MDAWWKGFLCASILANWLLAMLAIHWKYKAQCRRREYYRQLFKVEARAEAEAQKSE
jgi:hypothetical protein